MTRIRRYIPYLALLPCLASPAQAEGFKGLKDLVASPEMPSLPDNSESSTQIMSDLIERFELDLSRHAKRYSLEESIQRSLEKNPIALKEFRLYQGLIWDSIATRREWMPSITIDSPNGPVGYNRKLTEIYTLPESNNKWSRAFSLQEGSQGKPRVKIEWSILNLSRNSRLGAQKDSIDAQELKLRQSIRELVLDVQSDFYELQMARQEEDVFQGIYDFSRNLVAKLESNSSNQSGEKIIAALKARSLQALSLRVSAQQNVIRLSSSLASMMALPADSFVLPSERLAVNGDWGMKLLPTIDIARKRREEVKIAKVQADSFRQQAKALLRGYIPEVKVEAIGKVESSSYSLRQTQSDDYLDANGFTLDKSVGLNLSWKVFDSGVLAAQSSAFRKKESSSLQQSQLDLLNIDTQVKSAYAVYSSQLIQLPVVKRELDQALLSLELRYEQSQQPSVTTITNLIQAIDQYQSAASRWFVTIQKYNTAIAQLYRYTSQWPKGVGSQVDTALGYMSHVDLETTN